MAKGKNYLRLEFYAKDCNLAAARLAAAAFSAEMGFSMTDIEEIKVAVSESVSNAMIHGYGGDETRIVTLTLSAFENELEMVVDDDGIGIKDVEQALIPAYSAAEDHLGLGFVFIQSFTDALDIRSAPGEGTSVRMCKRRRGE